MLRDALSAVLLRELAALRRAVEAYPDDDAPWRLPPGLPNAGGTLALHVAGNLRHYVGAVLGGSGYLRDRDAEFARRGVPRAALVAELDAASEDVERTLRALPEAALAEPYPERFGGRAVATGDWLVHLASHLAYHLGQLDYHRRVVTGDPRSIGALPIAALRERGVA
jgi:Protein of unknown function (DUF664)